ncbi:MAG TPA: PHP domain-containing protein [Chlamydiales bacterium]|jgi:predicted metal-dependent phosphoesterase TrpH|nr:PHP domain-containing protein [Chlamydiales bacterium]
MVDFRADLHCHTICSDGTDTPEEVLRKAASLGLQGLSITDHDTIDAYTPEIMALAVELNIRLLPGVELSSEWEKSSVHILGYGIDLQSSSLREFLVQMIQRRRERNADILQKLRGKGFVIELEELENLAFKTVGRPHIAHLMVQKGFVNSWKEAFDRYLKDGAPCYAPGIKFTPTQVIEQIHLAQGKAILAHPHFLPKGSFVRTLLRLPLDGLEGYYGNVHPFQEKPWIDMAKQRKWIVTGGSDYHGSVKPGITLGCSWVGLDTFELLQGPCCR